jgi:thiamine-phosphate diphosphorylase
MTAWRADRLRASLRLYLLADSGIVPAPRLAEAVASALRGGVTAVQLRAQSLSTIELLELARTLHALCAEAAVPFVLNDRVDVALAAEADGVHVGLIDPEEQDSPQDARNLLGPDAIVGVSVTSPHEARLATSHGASYVTAGPMFPQVSFKVPQGAHATGEPLLRSVRAATGLPLVVVGGIFADRAAALYAAGADGLCVGAAILRAPDTEAAARAFIAAHGGST